MANDKNREKTETAEGTAQADAKPRIIWDGSDIRSVYPNAYYVTGSREEIMLHFGTSQVPQTGQKEVGAQVQKRVVLNPFVAKRLALVLRNVIQNYESRYGPLDVEYALPNGPDQSSSPLLPFSKNGKTDERAELLFHLVKSLKVNAGLERSFKISEKSLLGNRFLLGTSKRAIKQKPHERILDICERLKMPEDFLEVFREKLPDADYVHFGFEENERTCVYKAYLEFYDKIEKEIKNQQNHSKHFLMHLGFKWDASDNTRRSIAKYNWHPSLSIEDILVRQSNILDPQKHRNSLEIARGIVSLASKRIPHHDILYLEVTEDNNPRRSFDINMYGAKLQLGELYPLLSKLRQHYSIPSEEFDHLYDVVKTKTFGHLSGGIDREGKDFLTVYYGVEGIQDYGAKPGLPSAEAPLVARSVQITSHNENPVFAEVEKTDEKARLLFQLVKDLNVQVGLERSFKFLEKTMLRDRFLLGFKRNTIRQKPHDRILNICRQIDMPKNFLATFKKNLSEANIVLFGFEGNDTTRLYKAYLEFGGRIQEAVKKNPDEQEPFIIHLGFKWDASDNSQKTMANYTCFPSFTVEDMLERISNVFYGHKHRNPFEIGEGIINLASSRVEPDEFLYFEAKEENNPRISFDVNLYRANLLMKEIYPFLMEIIQYYSIPSEEFHSLYETVKTQIFGHLTGGIDREGRDFLTVYFGEKGSSR